MTKRNDIYKCMDCGAMHQALHDGAGDPVCCGKPMVRIKDNFIDAVEEKHIPVIKKIEDKKIEVSVGNVEHPMTNEHYIEWVEVRDGQKSVRKFLEPESKPVLTFNILSDNFEVRAYCNQHGLWKA